MIVNSKKQIVALVAIPCLTLLIFTVIVFSLKVLAKDPDPLRYADQIKTFALEDELIKQTQRNIVFVGSSSIRGWNLIESFPEIPTLNRGFGGSELSDIDFFLDQTVLKHQPDIVVVYAGENDITGHKSSDTVLEDYKGIVDRILFDKPNTVIVYISIKPTPTRWQLWTKMSEANEKIQVYSQQYENLYFIDVARKMLSQSGKIQQHLYQADGIHLTPMGYTLWTEALAEVLLPLYQGKN